MFIARSDGDDSAPAGDPVLLKERIACGKNGAILFQANGMGGTGGNTADVGPIRDFALIIKVVACCQHGAVGAQTQGMVGTGADADNIREPLFRGIYRRGRRGVQTLHFQHLLGGDFSAASDTKAHRPQRRKLEFGSFAVRTQKHSVVQRFFLPPTDSGKPLWNHQSGICYQICTAVKAASLTDGIICRMAADGTGPHGDISL